MISHRRSFISLPASLAWSMLVISLPPRTSRTSAAYRPSMAEPETTAAEEDGGRTTGTRQMDERIDMSRTFLTWPPASRAGVWDCQPQRAIRVGEFDTQDVPDM